MPTLVHRSISITLAGVFSAVPALATEPAVASPSPRATLELRVAPMASGTALTSTGGTVRLLLSVGSQDGVDIAPADPVDVNPLTDAVRLSSAYGPALVWTNTDTNPLGFSAAATLTDMRPRAEFNDRAARAVQWPIKGWPDDAARTFEPDALADELSPDTRRLVQGWLGAQTRAVTPAVLAKYLAARTLTQARADLEPMLVTAGTDEDILGLRSRGVVSFAQNGAGTEFDMLRVYSAALRIAGIPARTITGVRVDPSGAASLHAWVEFYLYEERSHDGRWIVVDLIGQRRLATDPPPLADPWRGFGANDAILIPLVIGAPSPSTSDPTLLTLWRVECDPPCVPLRVSARVVANGARMAQR